VILYDNPAIQADGFCEETSTTLGFLASALKNGAFAREKGRRRDDLAARDTRGMDKWRRQSFRFQREQNQEPFFEPGHSLSLLHARACNVPATTNERKKSRGQHRFLVTTMVARQRHRLDPAEGAGGAEWTR